MEVAATVEECWDNPGSLCTWVYDQSGGNETLANLADWFIDKPLKIVVILLVAWILTVVARRWIQRLVARVVAQKSPAQRLEALGIDIPATLDTETSARKASRAHSVSVLLTSTLIAVIWVVALLTVLGIFDIDLGPLIASAGIAGVALGFGAQTLVRDFIAGLFMMLEDQYGIGDVIDLGEATGTVEDISLRTTVLRGLDGTVWHVPNGVVERVGNKSQLWSVAVVDVDVAYDSDLSAVRDVFLRATTEVCDDERFADRVYEPPEVLGVEALAADGITLRLIVRVEPGAQFELQRAIREHVKQVFDDADIEIPFPQRTVWMRDEPTSASTPERG